MKSGIICVRNNIPCFFCRESKYSLPCKACEGQKGWDCYDAANKYKKQLGDLK
jgi:hypothetical protein